MTVAAEDDEAVIARAEVIGAIVTGYGAPRDLGPDEIALVQMFAERLAPAMRTVQLFVGVQAARAVLRVGDTGIGIVPQMLPHIFDLFVRDPRARVHARDGLGIGLTLVRHLVEIHGGRVAARSEGPDRGSEFTVRLPLAVGAEADRPAAAATPSGAAYDVLVIEDNVDARETLRDLLEHEGHRVDVADDGPSGLAQAEANRPQAVLIDLELPGLDGYGIAARIRARRAGEPLLVAVTGYADAEHRRRSIEAGFDAHLTKPVLSDDLIGVLGLVASRSLRAVPSGRADVAHESDRRP